jgi:addiction module RelB/DinJ family antitoxin
MKTATINLKVDLQTKKLAQKMAEDLGISLSSILTASLKTFTRTGTVNFTLAKEESFVPTPYLEKVIEEAMSDYKNGDYKTFENTKDLFAHLDSLK